MGGKREQRKAAIREFVESNKMSPKSNSLRPLLLEKMKNHPAFAGLSISGHRNETYICIRELYGHAYTSGRASAVIGPNTIKYTGDGALSLDDVFAKFPVTIGEIDELKPLLKRVRKFLLPWWEKITNPCGKNETRAQEKQIGNLNLKIGDLEEKNNKLFAANQKLQERVEHFQREAEKNRTKFDPARHGVVCGD